MRLQQENLEKVLLQPHFRINLGQEVKGKHYNMISKVVSRLRI